ncbi:MAG: hypothetical protein ABH885_05530, partial [Candidatus Omnitrophota bacterium]
MRKSGIVILAVILGLLTLRSGFCSQKPDTSQDLYKQVELFADSITLLKMKYVKPVDAKELI